MAGGSAASEPDEGRAQAGSPSFRHASRGQLGTPCRASPLQSLREREQLQSALAHRAAHDPLTELPNRAQALTLVTSALHRAQRSGHATGMLFVDLDGFKAVNDSHGHACGDAVLREVAGRLRDALRPGTSSAAWVVTSSRCWWSTSPVSGTCSTWPSG